MFKRSYEFKSYLPLLWMLAIPVLNVFYGVLNHPGEQVRSLATALDAQIPLITAFAVPYVLWYPFIALTLVSIFAKNAKVYYQTLLALCAGLVACYIVYALFQTTVVRPPLTPDGMTDRLLSMVYAGDNPYNCFPSIHVMTSFLMFRGASVFGPVSRTAVRLMAFTIIVSTLMVKQHVLADVAAGIVTAEIAFRIARKCAAGWHGARRAVRIGSEA